MNGASTYVQEKTGVRYATAAIVAVVLLLTSCGIPAIPFLEPPISPGTTGTSSENIILTFRHSPLNDENTPDFGGYELYYKLYPVGDARIDSDTDFIEDDPVQPGTSRLTQRGFVRAVVASERNPSNGYTRTRTLTDPRPAIPTEPSATSYTYRIDLRDNPDRVGNNEENGPDIVVEWNENGGYARGLRRRNVSETGVADPQATFDSFWRQSAYQSSDWDISRMGLTSAFQNGNAPERLEIVWYALSYGTNSQTFAPYYSEPLRLERAIIVFDLR